MSDYDPKPTPDRYGPKLQVPRKPSPPRMSREQPAPPIADASLSWECADRFAALRQQTRSAEMDARMYENVRLYENVMRRRLDRQQQNEQMAQGLSSAVGVFGSLGGLIR